MYSCGFTTGGGGGGGGGKRFFLKIGFFGTTNGDAWTPRLRPPSLIMAPVFTHLNWLRLGTEGRYSITNLEMFLRVFSLFCSADILSRRLTSERALFIRLSR